MREVAKRVLDGEYNAAFHIFTTTPEIAARAKEDFAALALAYLEAEKVIAYYADPDNWRSYDDVDETWPPEIPKEDRGKRARAFLAEQEAGKT